MKQRGHPIRGAIAGFFFGLFLSLDLVIFGVVALDADILALFPVLGLAAGIALGLTAPLKRRSAQAEEPPVAELQPFELQPSESQPAEQAAAGPVTAEPDHSTV